jgi:iron complex outermembrane receptor protein
MHVKTRYILMTTSALVAAIGAASVPVAAGAADAAAATGAAEGTTIGEVVVTAERFKSTVQTTPVAVSAFSPVMLQERQVISVQQFSSQIPGLVITPATGTSTSARIVLRGAGQENSGINFDPAVGIYIDGVYQPRITGAFFDFFDIDRVEVLRGPQGTLYGRNSSGGAIKIETKRPSYAWHWGGDIAFGEHSLAEARAFVTGPIVEDQVAFSLSGVSRKRDGFLTAPSYYGRKVNDKDSQAFRAKLLFNPIEKLEIQLSGDYQQDHSDPGIGVPLQAPIGVDTQYATGAGRDLTRTELFGPTFAKLQSVGGSLNASYQFTPELTLLSITGYRNLRASQQAPLWPTLAAQTSGNGALNIGTVNRFRDHNFSQEFNLTWVTDKFKGVIGAYYFDEKGEGEQFPPYSAITFQYRGTRATAIFGQLTYNITEQLSITGGARATREEAKFTQFYPAQLAFPQSDEKTFKGTSPKVAVNWQPTPNLLTYVSFTKGFKSGGFNPVPPNTNIGVIGVKGSPTPYGEEKVDSYEAGFKFTTDDHRARINVAIFEAKYKGLQLPVFFPGTSNSYTSNASDATIKGIELEPTWQVTDNLQLYGIMAFQKGKYTSPFVCSDQFGVFQNCDDRKIKGLIPSKVVVGATFSPELSIPGQIKIAADVDYTDNYYNNVSNTGPLVQTPETTLFNGSIAWKAPGGNWSVALEGRNIFNKHYVLAGLQLASPVRPTVTGYPGDPRIIDIRLSADF